MSRTSSSRLVSVVAECQSCSWRSTARNAAGTAPRHHDATGHVVTVSTMRETTYGQHEAGGPSLLDLLAGNEWGQHHAGVPHE